MAKRFLITGGAGFIGCHLIARLLKTPGNQVCNVDSLTYAANLQSIEGFRLNSAYRFEEADICDAERLTAVINEFRPNIVINLAAESHVDNSIACSEPCVRTNILGVHSLLEVCTAYWRGLAVEQKAHFRFYQISTDEVFGDAASSAANTGRESIAMPGSAYRPSSPYSATKAAGDHLVNAWHRTYQLPTLISASSNNYGPGQHVEKLIPMAIHKALAGEAIGLYGNGEQRRDWLYVEDHVAAIELIALRGEVGGFYLVSAEQPLTNRCVILKLCALLDELAPRNGKPPKTYAELIDYIQDRPGHDGAYVNDSSELRTRLGWQPETGLEEGLRATVLACLQHR